MSGAFWIGWASGVGGFALGQVVFRVWRYRWSRRARAVRHRIAIMEYDLGYSDKPITSAQHMDAHAKTMAKMYEGAARFGNGWKR